MCTGRIDLSFIFRAFSKGIDGVFIGGCWPGECHYITEGNYIAFSTVNLAKRLLEYIGIIPDRLKLEWISAAEGSRYAELMNSFSNQLKETGPLSNDMDDGYNSRLDAVKGLIPYIKLVERERLRIPLKTVEEYNSFFASKDFNRLFRELIIDRLNESRMMTLLREKSLSAADISEALGIGISDVSQSLDLAARQGMIKFDRETNFVRAALPNNGDRRLKEISSGADDDKVNEIINEHKGKPGSLIHVLMEVQSVNHWLSKEILDKISKALEVPLSRVMQTASFYKTFCLTPKGHHEVHVCNGTSCHLRGASDILQKIADLTGKNNGETDIESNFSVEEGNCLGCCSLGPEIIVDGRHYPRVTPEKTEDILKLYE